MDNKPLILGVSGILLMVIVVAAVLAPEEDSGSSDLPVGPVTPPLTVPGPTSGPSTPTTDESTSAATPTKIEEEVYSLVEVALSSPDNPANREIPSEFLSSDRDEDAFQKWTVETLDLGVAYQQNVFKRISEQFDLDPDKVASVHIEVRDWRQANGIPLN